MSFREYIEGINVLVHQPDNKIMPDMHYHNAYEIYIAEADRTYIVENKLIYLKPRDVILLKPDVIHCVVSDTQMYSLVELSEEYLHKFFSDYAIQLITDCFEKTIIRVRESDFGALLSLAEKLRDNNDDVFSLIQLLLLLKNNMSRSTYNSSDTGSLAANIVDYITENYKSIDNLDDTANKFHISKQYLCNLFKEQTGTSIKKYINILKVHASLELLLKKNLSMGEIAEKSGFSSLANFSKTFKSVIGMSPLKYSRINDINKNRH